MAKKIKPFSAPRVEARIRVSDEMIKDMHTCRRAMKAMESGPDCNSCSWNEVMIAPKTWACGLDEVVRQVMEMEENVENLPELAKAVPTPIMAPEWIPVTEKLPKDDNYILLSFENFIIPMIGKYEENEEGGAFFVGDDDASCVSDGLYVNAWMPLPEPYRPQTLEEAGGDATGIQNVSLKEVQKRG